MHFELTPDRKRRRLAVALGVLAAAAFMVLARFTPFRSRLMYTAAFALMTGAMAALPIAFKIEIRSWWGLLLANAAVAFVSVLIVTMPMYQWTHVKVSHGLLVDSLLVMALLCLGSAVTGNVKGFGVIWMTACLIFGIIDCAVVQFTGNLITYSDFGNINTAASVASQYHLKVTASIVMAVLIYILALIAMLRLKEPRAKRGRLPVRVVALICALACGTVSIFYLSHKRPRMFRGKGIIHNGLLGELVTEMMDSFITAPDGYSDERVQQLSAENAGENVSENPPHVIAVMMESFCDLSVLGNLETNVDYMPFFHSLASESIHGWATVSTVSGGTARSEWEFITGNSLAFMPSGCMPYAQYMGAHENSAVAAFKNAGYHTVAMHPFYANGWHRSTTYPAFGFDETYFIDDLEWDGHVRSFVSDSAFVHQIIRVFEERPADKPLFFFGVSMQNHGGYDYKGFEADVHLLSADDPVLDQFLSLTRLSDAALEELVNYFRNSDEKVQMVIFGDHQPSLSGTTVNSLATDRKQRYIVPFVIWNNFDQKTEEVELTSLNYLMARTMQEVGLNSAPYFNFLNTMRQTVPAISAYGYLYDGVFHPLEEAPKDLLNDYRYFQYGNIFRDDLDEALFVGKGENQGEK